MPKILIVEDDNSQQKMLTETIHSKYPSWTTQVASNYEDALFCLQQSLETKQYFSLFLLDIQLSQNPGDRGGYIFANEIRKNSPYFMTPLLFLTAISDDNHFALSHYHCYNYIAKPYTKETILFQLQQMLLTGYLKNTTLKLQDLDHVYHQVPISSIEAIQSKGHVLIFQLQNGTIHSREYSLSTILEKLGMPFIRCHKTTIINLDHVSSLDKKTSTITVEKHSYPVGRTHLPELEVLCQEKI